MPLDALEDGLADCEVVQVPSGRKVVEQGEYDDTCFILVSGQCLVVRKAVYKTGKTLKALVGGASTMGHTMGSGEPGAIGHLVAGDFFGELSVMSPWPRTSTVITSVDSIVLQITNDVFERWLDASDHFRETMDAAYMSRGLKTILKSLDAFAPQRRRRARDPRPKPGAGSQRLWERRGAGRHQPGDHARLAASRQWIRAA